MDRSLDDTIAANRARNPRQSRDRRPPRDGIRKNYRRDESRNLDRDWLHDRYDEDSDSRPQRDQSHRLSRRDPVNDPGQPGGKLKAENLHYDLTEVDLRELFTRIGPISNLQLVYDRQDRSTGVAYITYPDARDARTAVTEFDGANANGQPIRLTMVPVGARGGGGPKGGSLFDRVDEGERRRRRGDGDGNNDEDFVRDGRVDRPRRGGAHAGRRGNADRSVPEHIDRYVPGQGSDREREPRRGGGIRGRGGRRPGQRRDNNRDQEGHTVVQGRPRKTAEELDQEMSDYWGKTGNSNAKQGEAETAPAPAPANGGNARDDVDMDA